MLIKSKGDWLILLVLLRARRKRGPTRLFHWPGVSCLEDERQRTQKHPWRPIHRIGRLPALDSLPHRRLAAQPAPPVRIRRMPVHKHWLTGDAAAHVTAARPESLPRLASRPSRLFSTVFSCVSPSISSCCPYEPMLLTTGRPLNLLTTRRWVAGVSPALDRVDSIVFYPTDMARAKQAIDAPFSRTVATDPRGQSKHQRQWRCARECTPVLTARPTANFSQTSEP